MKVLQNPIIAKTLERWDNRQRLFRQLEYLFDCEIGKAHRHCKYVKVYEKSKLCPPKLCLRVQRDGEKEMAYPLPDVQALCWSNSGFSGHF